MFLADGGNSPQRRNAAERMDGDIGAPGPVAQVLGQGLLVAAWTRKPGPYGDQRHRAFQLQGMSQNSTDLLKGPSVADYFGGFLNVTEKPARSTWDSTGRPPALPNSQALAKFT